MMIGTLIDWNDARNYGFLKPDDGSKDTFVHISEIKKVGLTPEIGDRYIFEVAPGRDGRIAARDLKFIADK